MLHHHSSLVYLIEKWKYHNIQNYNFVWLLQGCGTWSHTEKKWVNWGCSRTGCRGKYLDITGSSRRLEETTLWEAEHVAREGANRTWWKNLNINCSTGCHKLDWSDSGQVQFGCRNKPSYSIIWRNFLSNLETKRSCRKTLLLADSIVKIKLVDIMR